jgi:hypothetical protein
MNEPPLLPISAHRVAAEQRRAQEKETAVLAWERGRRRVFRQCILLSFAGVPLYALSWRLADNRTADLLVAAGFFVSYALPFFRWLAWHLKTSDAFNG